MDVTVVDGIEGASEESDFAGVVWHAVRCGGDLRKILGVGQPRFADGVGWERESGDSRSREDPRRSCSWLSGLYRWRGVAHFAGNVSDAFQILGIPPRLVVP